MKLYQQKWLEKLDHYIKQYMADFNFSTHQLALCMEISLSSLHRKLEYLCRCTPAEYIKNKRLQQARNLVNAGNSIQVVAKKVGYRRTDYLMSIL